MKKLFSKKVPLYLLLLITVLTLGVFYSVEHYIQMQNPVKESTTLISPQSMNQLRKGGYQYVRPLVMADLTDESPSLTTIKQELQQYINEAKASQQTADVSIYFRRMNDGAWFSINSNQVYNPASLIKVAFLITYLKKAETSPGLLDKKLHFVKGNPHYVQNIKTPKLQEDKDYTIRYLLNYMIQYSDNDATTLLQDNADAGTFVNLFNDLQIPVPDFSKEYFMTTTDMSKLFRILYNGTYLSKESSEYALELLTKSEFKNGLMGGIDQPVMVAHKFGERLIGNSAQLHEFGIVYCGDQPYLIGVMTTGTNLDQLSAVIKKISSLAFHQYKTSFGC